MGIPVLSADRFHPARVDAIVLSSHGYEQDMAVNCSERWPGVKVLPIWRPIQPAEDFAAVCHERIPTALYPI
jgi:hypothetical protein